VPAHALIVGNPGKVVAWVDKKGNKLSFDKEGYSTCKQYQLKEGNLLIL